MQVILERAGMQMDANGCRRTEADGEGMAGGSSARSTKHSPPAAPPALPSPSAS